MNSRLFKNINNLHRDGDFKCDIWHEYNFMFLGIADE